MKQDGYPPDHSIWSHLHYHTEDKGISFSTMLKASPILHSITSASNTNKWLTTSCLTGTVKNNTWRNNGNNWKQGKRQYHSLLSILVQPCDRCQTNDGFYILVQFLKRKLTFLSNLITIIFMIGHQFTKTRRTEHHKAPSTHTQDQTKHRYG
jgi:hypothetical protein